jgi:hypothetical protein
MAEQTSLDKAPARATRIALVVLATLLTIALFLLAIGVGATRTVVISAETSSLELEFSGDATYWNLGEATLCIPLEKPDRSKERGTDFCDPRWFEQSSQDVSIPWADGNKIELLASHEGMEIQIVEAQGFESRTIVYVPKTELPNLGVLSFSGFANLGQVASSGETKLLTSGSFDIREKPFLNNATETIKRGEFRLGDKVSITHLLDGSQEPTQVYGFVLPDHSTVDSFSVSLVSEIGPSSIAVHYFGGHEKIEIAPNWIDRSIASPLILALSILIPIFLALSQVILSASNGINAATYSRVNRSIRNAMKRIK